MNCPHCNAGYTDAPIPWDVSNPEHSRIRGEALARGASLATLASDDPGRRLNDIARNCEGVRSVIMQHCPECGKTIVEFSQSPPIDRKTAQVAPPPSERWLAYPRRREHDTSLPATVPEPYRTDFKEAAVILEDSPRGSAALSRRCLQRIIREEEGIKGRTLYDEMLELLDKKVLPPYLSKEVDAIRHFGNVGAHPTKSVEVDQLIDVEEDEAKWCLDILRRLIEHYFVRAAESAERVKNFNEKMKITGKGPLLTPKK